MNKKTWFMPAGSVAIMCGFNTAVADRVAIIDDSNKVVNVVEVPSGWSGASGEWQVPAGHTTQPAANAAPNDTWNGSEFVKTVIELTSLVITYDEFEARFTADELDAIGKFAYAVDGDGVPKNVRVLQALQRAVASDKIDLLAAKTETFLNNLVIAEILTEDRKAVILKIDEN